MALASLALGVILNILGTYTTFFAGDMRLVGGFAIILVVLVFRPAGLFGRLAPNRA